MRDETGGTDLRNLWQNQPAQTQTMTPEELRQRAVKLRGQTRKALLRGLATPLMVTAALAWIMTRIHIGGMMKALGATAIVWSLAGLAFLNRGMWSAGLPESDGTRTALASYKREVERRHQVSRRFLLWSLGPVSLALVAFTAPLWKLAAEQGVAVRMLPFAVLLIIWIGAVAVIRFREQRELRREIETLDRLEQADAGAVTVRT